MRRVRSDGDRAIGANNDTPRSACGRSSNAVVAKYAGLHLLGWSKSLDVETHADADRMNEIAPA